MSGLSKLDVPGGLAVALLFGWVWWSVQAKRCRGKREQGQEGAVGAGNTQAGDKGGVWAKWKV